MICWENKLRRHLIICSGVLFSLAISGGIAGAQAPIPLRPPQATGTAPAPPVTPPPPDAEIYPGTSQEDGVSSGALGDLDFAAAGLLTLENGGFGTDMWRGANRAMVERLLAKLPVTSPSPTLQKLTRRLLLSAAEPPQGTGTGVSFLGLRLTRLIDAGQFELAGQMAALAGSASKDEAVLQARAEIALAANELKTACDLAAAHVRTSNAVFWLKLSGFCHVLNNDETAAQLSASLVAEQDPDDAGYQNLLTALINKTGKLPKSVPQPDILQMAMIRFASLPLPEKVADNSSAAILKLMARLPSASAGQRLMVAARAEAAGAIAPEEVVQLYSEIPFPVEDRANARDLAPKLPASKANALMFQSVRGQDSPASLALALSAAWSLGRASNSLGTVARVNLTPVRDLAPAPEMIEIAADAGRALLLADDPVAARRWYDLAVALGVSGNNPSATRASHSLWPLMRLALPVEAMPDNPAAITAWLTNLSPEEKAAKGPLLLSAMSALGLATPEAEWVNLTQDTAKTDMIAIPPVAILHLLMEAGQSGRTGQTVLLSLICMGENGKGMTNPLLLGIAVRALNSAGLRDEARALALEAALFAGI